MKYCRILLLFFLLINGNSLLAQWRGVSLTIPSPNASSLGLYGEIPVSYFTGVPNISIPLYEVKGKKISLPITLSYHASGLRPEMHPGWVGNGWSLQAGGVITRKVNGNNDEYSKSFAPKAGYYFNYSNLDDPNWGTYSTTNRTLIYPVKDNPHAQADADSEPDEFDFNFLGYSGKFFLDQKGVWQVQSDQNLKVVFNSSDFITPFIITTQYGSIPAGINIPDVTNPFGKFTIYDDQGNQYIFGSTHPSTDPENGGIEYTDRMIPASGEKGEGFTATSWYLSQIISSDGAETINLNYERGPFTSYIGFSQNQAYSNTSIPAYSVPWFTPASQLHCNTVYADQYGFSGSIISPVYLKSITMPSQDLEIDFNKSASNELTYPLLGGANYLYGANSLDAYSRVYIDNGLVPDQNSTDFPNFYLEYFTDPNLIPYFNQIPAPSVGSLGYTNRLIWLKLDNFIVKNTAFPINSQQEKTVNFTYNNNPQKRLQLNYLSIADKTGIGIQNYSFAYNQTPLPQYLTTITDHWGFNNNQTATGTAPVYDLVRAPDATGVQTQAEILTGITYPTGGTSTFVYEPNTYDSVVYRSTGAMPIPEMGIAGGLRIKQINTNDNNGNILTKKYFYVDGYTTTANPSSLPSSGVLDSKPQYAFVTQGNDLSSPAIPFIYTFLSSNPIIPLTYNTTGTHIGYSTVVEQRSDGSYSTFNFTNHSNGFADLAPVNFINKGAFASFQYTSQAFKRGRLARKSDYNSGGYLVADNITNYATILQLSANAVFANTMTICTFTNLGAVSRTAYLLDYSPFLPVSQISKIYDLTGGGNNASTTTNTTYDQYKNITERDVTNSDGIVYKTSFFYPNSFTNSNSSNPYNMMVSANMSSAIIEKRTSVIVNGLESVSGGQAYTYQQYGPNKFYNDAAYNFESIVPVVSSNVSSTTYKGIATLGDLSLDSHYTLRQNLFYDDNGNVTSTLDNSGHVSSYLWDYNKSKPVAAVKNASNIYPGVAPVNNIATTNTFNVFVAGTLHTPVIQTITVQRTGPVTVSFVYNNNGITGNNSSTLNLQLTGNGRYQSVSICTSTPGGTSSCGATPATATINNVAPGTYVIYLEIVDMTGFQNYYGYTATVGYPVYQYYTVPGKNDIAYTSFEYNAQTPTELSNGGGNWSGINISNISIGTAFTGSGYYTFNGTTLTSLTLNPAQTYYVSYWSQNGVYTVSGSQSYVQGITSPSGWTFFKHTVTGVSTASISGTGNIDELRLYPAGSQMTTYTYEPLVGIKNIVDVKQEVTSYNYDNFQRLSNIKDEYGNIVKSIAYNYAAVTQPVITNVFIAAPLTIGVSFTPISNCTAAQVNYVDTSTGQNGNSSAGGCGGSGSVSVPNSGHTYTVTVTCYIGGSPVTSAPVTIAMP